jgi:hypothetical protein
MELRHAVAVLVATLAASVSAQEQPSSIVLMQPAPRCGAAVNYTIVYPKEAARRVGRKQMVNPNVVTFCSQNNATVYNQVTSADTTVQNGDGTMTSATGFVTLSSPGWSYGGAECSATLYYFSADKATGGLTYNYLASTTFIVGE